MTLIDLGEMTPEGGETPPAPLAVRRLRRQVSAVVVAVLTLLGVTGSTAAVRHTVRPLWTTTYDDGSSMEIDDTTLYAGQVQDGRATLSAFDLATGRKRWTVPAGEEAVSLRPAVGGVLVMPETATDLRIRQDNGTFKVETMTSSTIARDAATGRQMWSLPGDALATYPGSVLMGRSDDRGNLIELRVVGARDGVTRWTRSLRDVEVWGLDDAHGRPARVLLGDRTGLLTVIDYADGSTVHAGRPGGNWLQDPSHGVFASMQVIGDRLVIMQADERSTRSVVYRLADFRELWRAEGFVIDCAGVLCTMTDAGLAGRDPETGRRLWLRPDLNGVWPVAGGRFLGNGPSSQGPYQLVDPLTGRGVGDVVHGESTWSGGTPSGSVLMVGAVAGDYKRSTVIQLDLDTGRSYLLGAIAEAGQLGCLSAPGYLACARADRIEVTAVG